jgi:hypothetical protein
MNVMCSQNSRICYFLPILTFLVEIIKQVSHHKLHVSFCKSEFTKFQQPQKKLRKPDSYILFSVIPHVSMHLQFFNCGWHRPGFVISSVRLHSSFHMQFCGGLSKIFFVVVGELIFRDFDKLFCQIWTVSFILEQGSLYWKITSPVGGGGGGRTGKRTREQEGKFEIWKKRNLKGETGSKTMNQN